MNFSQIKNVAAYLLGLLPHFLSAQSGCTDPQALNFDDAATQNDGTCLYATTYLNAPVKTNVADTLREISGLIQAGNRWWSHNDGGNDHTFMRFDPINGSILQYVKLKQAENEDWEDITTDGTRLYLGDFGNNASGNRTDLRVYKVALSKIGNNFDESVDEDDYSKIPFEYEDQQNFDPVEEDSIVFDCEAFIHFGGQLHLFGKNWRDRTCTHYYIDETADKARKVETFDVQGLVTAAALSPDGKVLMLLVYNKAPLPEVYVWLLWDWSDGRFFNGHKRRLELGSPIIFGKSEALAFDGDRTGYIGNEFLEYNGFLLVPQQIRTFNIEPYVPLMVGTSNLPTENEQMFHISPNPFSQYIDIQPVTGKTPDFVRLRNSLGQVVFEKNKPASRLDSSDWTPGFYFLEILAGHRIQTIPILKNN